VQQLTNPTRVLRHARGFTLVELAVTLFIVTLLLGSVLVPLQTQVESRKIEETQRLLEQAREALLGFVAAHGYFPCPATAASAGNEPSPPATDHTNGSCATFNGFLPAALLGTTPVDAEGFAIDAWGGAPAHRIRYAVSNHNVNAVQNPFTMVGGMAAAGVPALGGANQLLYICGSGSGINPNTDCGAGVPPLASNAVAVIWSAGANALTGGTNVHESQNVGVTVPPSLDRTFVSRIRVSSGTDEFDDQLIWIPTYIVVTRMVASGMLP
jgi:prepilin-type N-terminal cleavage/methylation domain-containing protein